MPDEVSETLKRAVADADAASQAAVSQAAGIRKAGEEIVRISRVLAGASGDTLGGVLGFGIAVTAACFIVPHVALVSLAAIPFIALSGGVLGVIGARLTKRKPTPIEQKREELEMKRQQIQLIQETMAIGLLTKGDAQKSVSQMFLGESTGQTIEGQLTDGEKPMQLTNGNG